LFGASWEPRASGANAGRAHSEVLSSFKILHYKIKPRLKWCLAQLVPNKDKQVSKSILSQCQFKLVKCLWLWCFRSDISNLSDVGLFSQMYSEGIINIQLLRTGLRLCDTSPLVYWGTLLRKTSLSTLTNVSYFPQTPRFISIRSKVCLWKGTLEHTRQVRSVTGRKRAFHVGDCTETVVWLSLVAVQFW